LFIAGDIAGTKTVVALCEAKDGSQRATHPTRR
jgi:hypothetical protein